MKPKNESNAGIYTEESNIKIWVVISNACPVCDSSAIGIYDHAPTEEEQAMLIIAVAGCLLLKQVLSQLK